MVMSHQWVTAGTYFCIIGRLLRSTISIIARLGKIISTVVEEIWSKFAPNFGMQEFESLTILSMCWQMRRECCRQRWREEDWRWDSCKVKCQRSRDVQKNNGGCRQSKKLEAFVQWLLLPISHDSQCGRLFNSMNRLKESAIPFWHNTMTKDNSGITSFQKTYRWFVGFKTII